MIRVTQASFYGTVGRLDVHPSLAGGKYDQVTGFTSTWKLRDGTVLGRSDGGTYRMKSRYWVTPEFFKTNAATLVRLPEEAA